MGDERLERIIGRFEWQGERAGEDGKRLKGLNGWMGDERLDRIMERIGWKGRGGGGGLVNVGKD